MSVTHELKTWPGYWAAVASGVKTFEIRREDRGFKVGDVLKLNEYTIANGYTGRVLTRRVTYLLDLTEILPGVQRERYVALALGLT